jgi:hypothetical protein
VPDHTRLRGVAEVGRPLLSDQLQTNLVSFFQWGLLGAGGFSNVRTPASGAYGGRFDRLQLCDDPYYQKGQVWQSTQPDWVWESGVEYHTQPIRVSGVNVDGVFYPSSTTGAFAHTINYPLGRVTFDSPVNPTGVVTCEFSHRSHHFYAADCPWWRELQQRALRPDDSHYGQYGSGAYSVLAQNRIPLPAVIVEAVPNTSRTPLECGNDMAVVRQDVLFHIFAETPYDRAWLHDCVTLQWPKRLVMFNKDWMLDRPESFPLDGDGSPAPSGLMYPDLVKGTGEGGFAWRQLRVVNFRSASQPEAVTAPLYVATVRAQVEVDI